MLLYIYFIQKLPQEIIGYLTENKSGWYCYVHTAILFRTPAIKTFNSCLDKNFSINFDDEKFLLLDIHIYNRQINKRLFKLLLLILTKNKSTDRNVERAVRKYILNYIVTN